VVKRIGVAGVMLLCLAVVSNGCGCGAPPRDVSTPRKALLGHWINTIPGSRIELYYSPDTVTYSDGRGKPISRPYKVTEEDQAKFTLKIANTAQGPTPSSLGFSADRKELFVYPARVPELLKYTYVDSKQNP
jgi:hypothetical protein